MVGQSMKTFPSHPSSHPEPGGTQQMVVGWRGKNQKLQILDPFLLYGFKKTKHTHQKRENGDFSALALCGGGHS